MAVAKKVGSAVKPFSIFAFVMLLTAWLHAGVYFVTVGGLGGEPDYDQRFAQTATDLDKLFKGSGDDAHVYTLSGSQSTRAKLTETLETVAKQAKATDVFVLVLIGHGSFDGEQYKFNLTGPDISGNELAALCDRIPSKRQLVVNTTSSSGGIFAALRKPGRAVVMATKTGTEKNATVFARYWVESLRDPTSDLDKNESISGLEAFLYANRKTSAFYESQNRLATEHAVFEDAGKAEPVRAASIQDGEGQLLSSISLIRIGSTQKAFSDPAKRALLEKKEALEQKIDSLKYQKAAMEQDEYKEQISAALLELARVQQELDK